MEINILYIDDQQPELDRCRDLIEENSNSYDTLRVDGIIGTELFKNASLLDNKSPELILVDFDFSNVDSSNEVLGMNGVHYQICSAKNFKMFLSFYSHENR
jgi:hypothetical protein